MNPTRILFASLIGTTIEFFDFYIYGTAAVLVFPQLFFPARRSDDRDAAVARDVRAGVLRAADRLGAVRSLRRPRRTQGDAGRGAADDGPVDGRDRPAADLRARSACWRPRCSRSAASARASGSAANGAARCCSRPRTRRPASARGTACFRSSARRSASSARPASSCCSPQCSSDAEFFAWGWRMPFIASALLVVVGLWVRLKITETPEFQRAVANGRARARCRS